MTFARMTHIQCRRAVISPAFFITILIFATVLILNSVGTFYQSVSVVYLFTYAMTEMDVLVICILPILPFGTSYAQEYQEKSARFYIVRTGAFGYATAKFVAVTLSGFLVVFLGFGLFAGVLSIWFPLFDGCSSTGSLARLLDQNKAGLYLLSYTFCYGLSGALFAGLAFWFSTWFNERYAVIILPFLAYRMLDLSVHILKLPFATRRWFVDIVSSSVTSPLSSVLQKFCFVILALLLLYYGTARQIERRVLSE